MQNNKIKTIQINYLNGLHSLYFLYLVLFCYWKSYILLFLLFGNLERMIYRVPGLSRVYIKVYHDYYYYFIFILL